MTAEWRLPPLGLYVHLPWCVSKCPYCDFNSHSARGPLPGDAYLRMVLEDLESDLPRVQGRQVDSIYLGGGTPSLFSARQIQRLLDGICARVRLAADAEVTLEANPGTVEHDRFTAYREAGVNRVSLGVQSFDDDSLRAIGRIHGRDEVEAALASLRRSGLENVNLDLMFGLPGQTLELAARDVELAMAAQPAHISHYQLTLEPNTAFAAAPPRLPSAEECWLMQEAAADMMNAGGYVQYEVSAWAAGKRQCRHNLNYWRFGDYLGIGAGAHAKLTDPVRGEVRRMARVRHPRRYLRGERVAEDRVVEARDLAFEYFLNVLRLRDGFEPGHFEARTGLAWEVASIKVDEAISKGLLETFTGGLRPTALGWRFGNDLQAMFLP